MVDLFTTLLTEGGTEQFSVEASLCLAGSEVQALGLGYLCMQNI